MLCTTAISHNSRRYRLRVSSPFAVCSDTLSSAAVQINEVIVVTNTDFPLRFPPRRNIQKMHSLMRCDRRHVKPSMHKSQTGGLFEGRGGEGNPSPRLESCTHLYTVRNTRAQLHIDNCAHVQGWLKGFPVSHGHNELVHTAMSHTQ